VIKLDFHQERKKERKEKKKKKEKRRGNKGITGGDQSNRGCTEERSP